MKNTFRHKEPSFTNMVTEIKRRPDQSIERFDIMCAECGWEFSVFLRAKVKDTFMAHTCRLVTERVSEFR